MFELPSAMFLIADGKEFRFARFYIVCEEVPLGTPESPPIVSGVSDMHPSDCPNVEETRNPMQTFSRKKCSHFSPTNIPSAFPHEIPKCILIILLIPKKSSMLIAAILFCHRSFDSTTRRIPLSNEISAVSATISLLTPSEQNPRRQASVRGYLNPFSVRCSTHSV